MWIDKYNEIIDVAIKSLDRAEYVIENNDAEYERYFIEYCFRYLRENIHEVISYIAKEETYE